MWDIEEIPDDSHLFYRIHKNDIQRGDVVPGAFKERGKGEERGMSNDWEKYSTPEESLNRSANPIDNGIVKFHVKKVREIGSLVVVHAPNFARNNRSHSHIKGIPRKGVLKTKIRSKLKRIFKWIIIPNEVMLKTNEFNF